VPTVDSISWETFHYHPVYPKQKLFRGIFEWGFLYKEIQAPTAVLNKQEHMSEPYW